MTEDDEYKEGALCPRCGQGKLRLRQTKRGTFWGCSNYPECDFLEPVTHRPQVVTVRLTAIPCPQCGEMLAVKRGRYGLFLGCLNYPACSYTSSTAEAESFACPVCQTGKLLPRFAKSGQLFYGCNNYPECRFLIPGKPVEKVCPRCSFPLMFEKKTSGGVALLCANGLCPSRKKHRRKPTRPRELSAAEADFLNTGKDSD